MPAIIELHSISKTFKLGDEVLNALDGINLEVNQGEFIAVVGPSGSGKTTLANIIGGLDKPSGGTVMIDGQDLSKASDRRLSDYRGSHIGFVFQSFNLQATNTALENVMLPMMFGKIKPKERKVRATAALQAVGLGERLKHKPSQLSGGQRQRVAIARAIVMKPSIIIADEPTGNLDSARGEEIMKILKALVKQGMTLLIITHDMAIARQADKIVEIRDGKLVRRG